MHLILRDYLGEGHQLVGAAVGAPDFKPRSRRFSEMGAWQSLRAVWVHKKRGAVASPSMRNFELESRDS